MNLPEYAYHPELATAVKNEQIKKNSFQVVAKLKIK